MQVPRAAMRTSCARDEYVSEMLQLAAMGGGYSVRRILQLTAIGIPLDARQKHGIWDSKEGHVVTDMSPLHVACIRGRVDVALALLGAGADANLATGAGDYPLHLAVSRAITKRGRRLVCAALLLHGADVNATDSVHNKTALQVAEARHGPRSRIACFLRSTHSRPALQAELRATADAVSSLQPQHRSSRRESAPPQPTGTSMVQPVARRGSRRQSDSATHAAAPPQPAARSSAPRPAVEEEALVVAAAAFDEDAEVEAEAEEAEVEPVEEDGCKDSLVAGGIQQEPEELCAICLDPLLCAESSGRRKVATLPCWGKHRFHMKCVTPWLQQSNACPTCRGPIVEPICKRTTSTRRTRMRTSAP